MSMNRVSKWETAKHKEPRRGVVVPETPPSSTRSRSHFLICFQGLECVNCQHLNSVHAHTESIEIPFNNEGLQFVAELSQRLVHPSYTLENLFFAIGTNVVTHKAIMPSDSDGTYQKEERLRRRPLLEGGHHRRTHNVSRIIDGISPKGDSPC